MDKSSTAGMLKLLENEAVQLAQAEQKILQHLHKLQVEEEMLVRTIKKLRGNVSVEAQKPTEIDAVTEVENEITKALDGALEENEKDE